MFIDSLLICFAAADFIIAKCGRGAITGMERIFLFLVEELNLNIYPIPTANAKSGRYTQMDNLSYRTTYKGGTVCNSPVSCRMEISPLP
jgi:hypothetical protein